MTNRRYHTYASSNQHADSSFAHSKYTHLDKFFALKNNHADFTDDADFSLWKVFQRKDECVNADF